MPQYSLSSCPYTLATGYCQKAFSLGLYHKSTETQGALFSSNQTNASEFSFRVTGWRPVKGHQLVAAWGTILKGHAPLLSIEITRECPLHCPGCYAYGDDHLGGATTLREVHDYRGDDLVRGVLDLVRKHRPLHISLVGGEPLVRHRELSLLLPELSRMEKFVLVVTSAVIPIP